MPGMVQIMHGFQTRFKSLARNNGSFLNEVQLVVGAEVQV